MATILHGRHFLGTIFQIIFVLATLVLFASADKADIEKPRFTYIERYLVKITYVKGVNRTLNICCDTSFPKDQILSGASCGRGRNRVSMCPDYKILPMCEARGQQVCCEVDGVQNKVTLKGYVAQFDGSTSVPLSDVATYVTNKSEIIPKSVSDVNIATNLQQGLDIHWTPLTRYEYTTSYTTKYEYLIHCKPLENRRAKAVLESEEITNSVLVINSKNITAVSKYRCCVKVVNLVSSLPSEPTCQNITTSEQAPSAGPVILCGNGTVRCPSVIKGTKRNITIRFELLRPEHRNGKIIRHEVYYRSKIAGNFTKLLVNGSQTEAVITNAETGMSYYVFMKSCTEIGCSPISNTVHIPAVSHIDQIPSHTVVTAVSIVASLVVVFLVVIVYFIRRHQRLQREKTLPSLKPKTDPAYEYPNVKRKEDDDYNELESQHSETSSFHNDDVISSQATVVSNPMALAAEQT